MIRYIFELSLHSSIVSTTFVSENDQTSCRVTHSGALEDDARTLDSALYTFETCIPFTFSCVSEIQVRFVRDP